MEENPKKNRGLGKGLSELLGEARAKAALSKQIKNDVPSFDENHNIETSNDYSLRDNDLSQELDNLHETTEEQELLQTDTREWEQANHHSDNDTEDMIENDDDDDSEYETITADHFDREMQDIAEHFQQEKEEPSEKNIDEMSVSEVKLSSKELFSKEINSMLSAPSPTDCIPPRENIPNAVITVPITHNNNITLQKDMIHELPIELVNPNKEQPRKFFDSTELNDLASSIKVYGIIQPILVKQIDNEYMIIAGERRWRAAQIAGFKTIPAIITPYQDNEILEIALIENIQRADLTPLDEANGYFYLMNKYLLTHFELSQRIGKSRSHISNMVRLLELDDTIKSYLETGALSIGHAKVLVGVKNAANLAEKIVNSHMSVRKTEELVSQLSEKQNVRLPKALNTGKNTDILALEADLRAALGVNVSVTPQTAQKGSLVIRYESLDQLDEVCRRLCSNWGAEVA